MAHTDAPEIQHRRRELDNRADSCQRNGLRARRCVVGNREAVRVPAAVGVNVTLVVQLAPATTLPPQLSVSLKSPGLAPVKLMLEIVRVPLPVFVRVTAFEGLEVFTS